ncbi:MAG: phosphate propanoyltransferase [Oscillospiraceae bacterium]|nr:phosphate propanoyltransferase [Oscillospiraceae bacterium]
MREILVEGSARHIHVTQEHLEILFGKGAKLNNKRELSQPGQYLTEEKVRLEGPRGGIDRVSILGPCRPETQAEISMTDARTLGLNPPVRMSGDLIGSEHVKIIGPAGSVELKQGCMVAQRHIHVTPAEAEALGLAGHDTVSLTVGGERGVTFHNVVVRIHGSFSAAAHLDYDEVNAAGVSGSVMGTITID